MVRVMTPKNIEADEDWGTIQVEDAPQVAVDFVTALDPDSEDGRSQWVWIRLPSGDLVLAIYPQGDGYFSTEQWRSI